MALNTLKYDYLMPLPFKGLKGKALAYTSSVTASGMAAFIVLVP